MSTSEKPTSTHRSGETREMSPHEISGASRPSATVEVKGVLTKITLDDKAPAEQGRLIAFLKEKVTKYNETLDGLPKTPENNYRRQLVTCKKILAERMINYGRLNVVEMERELIKEFKGKLVRGAFVDAVTVINEYVNKGDNLIQVDATDLPAILAERYKD